MKDYYTMFQNGPFSNWVYDLESGEILEVNEAALCLFGYSRKEFMGFTITEIVIDMDFSQFLISINGEKQLDGFQGVNIKTKSGALKNIKIMCQKLVFQQRNCAMATAYTMGNLNETELSPIGGQSRKNGHIPNLGRWKYDSLNDALSLSDEVFAIWGRNRDEMPLSIENIFNYLPIKDRKLFYDNMISLFRGQKDMDFEHRILLPDGSTRWVREQGKLIRNVDGQPSFFEGTVRYISDKRGEEQRLQLLESVVTHINDAIMITDGGPLPEQDPKIVYVNRAFTQMTGYKPEEIIGKTPEILRGPKTDRHELEHLYNILDKGDSGEVTVVNYRKNGSPFWINIAATSVKDIKGTVSHYIAIQRDVTSKINAQLEKDFLSKISTAFMEKLSLVGSLDQICKLVTFYGDFTFCEVWLPSINRNSLWFAAMFGKDESGRIFYEHSKDIQKMELGNGLPGTVWKTKQPVLWGNIDRNNLFIRKKAAQLSGVKSVLGIPLKHQGKIVGVMAVGTLENEKHFKVHYPVLSKLENYLGSEINRKRMEEDLTYLFETLPDLICLFDLKGNFLKMNKAGYNILGYSEDEILGNSYQEFIHWEDKEISSGLVQKIRDGQKTFEIENRYITKAGNLVWLSWHCKIALDEGVVYASAKDITKAKKLQEVVSDASRLAKIGGWEIDMINKKLTWSEGVHQIYETDPKEYTPELEHAINFFREDHREKVKGAINLAMEKGQTFDYEAAFISARHNEKWVRFMGQAEMVNGKCVRLYGSFQDITQLKEAEHRLLAINNDLPGVSFQYYIYPDGTYKMRSVSKKAYEIYNFSPEQCEKNANLIWDQVKKGGDYDSVVQDIQKSLEKLTQWNSRWRYVLPSGGVRWHEGYGTPYKLADGTILFNSMVFDVTEEVKLTHLLKETSELSQIGSWEMDAPGDPGADTMYWSPIAKKLIGVDEDYNPSLSGGLEFYTPESRSILEQGIEELIENGTEYDQEVILNTSWGKEKWVRIIGKSERANGRCTKIYGSIQDIHAMKTIQLQLQEILGSISDAFYAVDKDWNFTFFNKEAENLLGKKSDEVLGKNLWALFSPTLGTELETVYKRVAQKGKAESFEYPYPGNGSWYEINIYPSNGGVSVYFKDITLRKETDILIQQANQRFEKVAQATTDAIWDWDIENKVFIRSDGFERLFGIKIKKYLKESQIWEDSFYPDDLPKIQSSLKEALLDPSTEFWSKEYRIVHEKEGVKTVIDKGAIIRNEYGKAVRMVGAITDITEKQEYIETIETQNKKLMSIAWTQSHVVRSPLSRILGIINLLDMEPKDSEDIPFLLEQIKVSGIELDEIIRKIVSETNSIGI